MDLSSVHGNKLQMRYSHHYKSVDVGVQIKEMFLFFLFWGENTYFFLFFSIFIPIFIFFTSHLALDTLLLVHKNKVFKGRSLGQLKPQ